MIETFRGKSEYQLCCSNPLFYSHQSGYLTLLTGVHIFVFIAYATSIIKNITNLVIINEYINKFTHNVLECLHASTYYTSLLIPAWDTPCCLPKTERRGVPEARCDSATSNPRSL